jgi:hypothetical protein
MAPEATASDENSQVIYDNQVFSFVFQNVNVDFE